VPRHGDLGRDQPADAGDPSPSRARRRGRRGEVGGARDESGRPAEALVETAIGEVHLIGGWQVAFDANAAAWRAEWDRADVIIEGDDEAQLAIRFNVFQLLIAAPRHDDRVNLGAKTLSGFGYRGHAFWDTETFMLPLFTFTAPEVARNLLTARWRELPGARRRALVDGFEGARFPWESAGTGEEVTPTWLPDPADPTRVIRVWAGDLELHISADVAYAANQYWQASGDDAWFIDKGAEIVLDTARYWASRAEWMPDRAGGAFGYRDVVGRTSTTSMSTTITSPIAWPAGTCGRRSIPTPGCGRTRPTGRPSWPSSWICRRRAWRAGARWPSGCTCRSRPTG